MRKILNIRRQWQMDFQFEANLNTIVSLGNLKLEYEDLA